VAIRLWPTCQMASWPVGRREASRRFAHRRDRLEVSARAHVRHDSCANQEITEALRRLTFRGEPLQQCTQRLQDLRFADVLSVERVEALAAGARAEVQVVLAGRFPDQSDLGEIRTRTAVRATAHADRDRLFFQSERANSLVEL